jgi:acetyl esterase/lipase
MRDTQRRHTARNAAILIAAFLLCCFIAWPFIRAHLEALAVLKAVGGQPLPALLQAIATEPVTQHDELIQTEAGPVRARFYTPTRHPNAHGLVVFHGVHHLGIDEPRLMAFAQAMAASGLNVLTPELPDIKDYRVSERSIKVIGASAAWFAHQRGSPVGVMGLSFAGGLALVAAADAHYQPGMRFVFAVGSQGAMTRVADYYRTGSDPRPDGTTEILPAHEYGPLVLEYEHVEEFVPKIDAEPIRAVLRAHLYEDKPAEDAAAKLLTPKQSAEAKSMMDAASDSTRTLLQTSATKHLADMRALSPEAHLHDLTTPVFLLHGEGDNIIPAAETLWMASELKAETLQAALVSPVLSHLDVSKQPGAWDEWQLVHFMALVLRSAQR